MLAGISGFSVGTAACIKNCANNALGITVYRQTQRQDTAALLVICQLVAAPQLLLEKSEIFRLWEILGCRSEI